MTLTGEKVELVPAVQSDAKDIFQWLAQSDLTANMMGPPLFPEIEIPSWEDFQEDYLPLYFSDDKPKDGRCFVIEVEGKRVGQINFSKIDEEGRVELDIWLAGSSVVGKGLGPDAINTLCSHLKEEFQCRQIIIAPSARNPFAVRAYQRAGFEITNNAPDWFVPDYHDTVIMVRDL